MVIVTDSYVDFRSPVTGTRYTANPGALISINAQDYDSFLTYCDAMAKPEPSDELDLSQSTKDTLANHDLVTKEDLLSFVSGGGELVSIPGIGDKTAQKILGVIGYGN